MITSNPRRYTVIIYSKGCKEERFCMLNLTMSVAIDVASLLIQGISIFLISCHLTERSSSRPTPVSKSPATPHCKAK